MELTKQQIKRTKGIAILFMLLLHLFCTKQYEGLFTPIIMIGQVPLIYYLALFGDCCVAIYCFCSGYGLYNSYRNNKNSFKKNNFRRLFKLYINSWIILLIFVVIIGSISGKFNIFGGGMKDFILTVTLIKPAYDGAWWFLTTYIIMVLLSPMIYRLIDKYNYKLIMILSFAFYFIAYIQRIKGGIVVDNNTIQWFIRQLALLGTSQLPFIIGGIFAKYKSYTFIFNRFNKVKGKSILGTLIILAMIIFHGFVQTLFVAVLTGIVFICVFNIMDKPRWLNEGLSYLSNHSTNIWLIHMFIYMTYLKKLVYMPKYPVFIYLCLLLLCLGGSYVVDLIYKPIIRKIDNYKKVKLNGISG